MLLFTRQITKSAMATKYTENKMDENEMVRYVSQKQ